MREFFFTLHVQLAVLGWLTAATMAQETLEPSQWGGEHHGLQCRATAPAEIEQGIPLDIVFELRSDPAKLQPKTINLNVFLLDAFMQLKLTNLESKKVFTIQPYDPTSGMLALDAGKNTIPLDGTPIKPRRIQFPLATVFDELTPGSYEGQVHFSFLEDRTSWWRGTPEQWKSAGFWHGSVSSSPFRLKITKHPEKTKTIMLPKRLSAMTEKDEQGRPVKVVHFREQDAEKVTIPVRNGHFMGWRVIEAGTPGFVMMQGGTPRLNDANPIAEWRDDKRRGKHAITIELFETAVRAHHIWMPEASGYRVLWKKTFTVSAKP